MPYRGKPIAEGGFIPSQIGTGEAQVFQPIDTSFLEKSVLQEREQRLAREKMAAAQQQAQAKAQAKSDLDKEKKLAKKYEQLDQEYEGLFPKSMTGIHDMAVGTWEWLTENVDDPNVDMELFKQISSINQLTSTLKMEREQVKEWDKMKAEGVEFENWELLDQFDTDEFWADMAKDPVAFGVKLAEIMTSVKPKVKFDVITLAQKTAMKGKAGAPITGSFVDEHGIVNYTKTPDLKTWRNNLDLLADEQWKNTERLQEEYPADTKGGVGNSTWRELVWVNRPDATYSDSRRNPPKAKAKTGWQQDKGYAVMGDFIFTPKTTTIAGTDAVTSSDTVVQRKKGFPWLEITEKQITEQPGTPSREVYDYSISPFKKGSSLTKKMNILNPDNPEKTITVKPTRFRKDGENWFVMADWNDHNIHKTIIIPLGTISEESLAELDITVDLLEQWERQRLSGVPGSTAPRTTGGKYDEYKR